MNFLIFSRASFPCRLSIYVLNERSAPPPAITAVLKADNALDVELYKHAMGVANKAMAPYLSESEAALAAC